MRWPASSFYLVVKAIMLEGLRGIEESNVKKIGPRNCGRRITAGITFAWRKRIVQQQQEVDQVQEWK